jgi:polysaccharide biosynthesis protein PslA
MAGSSVNFDDSDKVVLEVSGQVAHTTSLRSSRESGTRHTARDVFYTRLPVSTVVWLADAGTIALVTLGLACASPLVAAGQRHVAAVAGLVCVLAFCLLSRNHRAASARPADGLPAQLLRLLPILLFSALAGALVFALLGWRWQEWLMAAGCWFAAAIVSLAIMRRVESYVLVHPSVTARMARCVAVIGSDGHASRVAALCGLASGDPIHFLGIFSDRPTELGQEEARGSVDELISLSRETLLDDIIIAVPPDGDAGEAVSRLRWRLRGVAAEVYIMPYLAQGEDAVLPVEMFGSLSLMVVQRRPLTHTQAVCKRVLDFTLGVVLLLLLFPVLIAVAVIVKLDSPGPVLFRQPRLGYNDRPFTVLKFRSMYADAADLMASQQTSRRDPRVTRVGKWLRKLSLDELPQIFNVLAGDMSLVGPRPHAPQTRAEGRLLKDAMAEYVIRHQVKPGITGWAQINGSRGEIVTMDDLRRRVNFDLEYIQKWSVWFDIKIIFMTVLREVFSKHAF